MPRVWQVVGALVVSFIVAAGFVSGIEAANDQAALRTSLAKRDATIDKVLAWQKRTQARLDELADQNAALVELLRGQGVDVPASLVTRTTVERDDGDDSDDDDGDTIIVRPSTPTARPTQRPTTSAPDNDDGDNVSDIVPEVDLPEPVGKATEDVKKIADDALDGTIPLIP